MAHVLTAQGPSQAQAQYILTQSKYYNLVHCFKTAMKFEPSKIVIKDSVLFTFVAGRKAVIKRTTLPFSNNLSPCHFCPTRPPSKRWRQSV